MELMCVFIKGWFVSFLGQLPLGTMSITSTQIAVQENFRRAWQYAIGVALVEIIYLRLTLSGVDWIMQHQLLFTILGWLTVVVFIVLGVASFVTAFGQQKEKKALILDNDFNRFALGLSMSALNPAQIPFWFIWSTYLLDNGALNATTVDFNIFTVGCGAGTIAGLAVYMYGGNWLITRLNTSNRTLNIIMGGIFFIAGAAQFYRMVWGEFL